MSDNIHNITISECSIDAVEMIEQKQYSEFTAMIEQIFESKLAAIAEAEVIEIDETVPELMEKTVVGGLKRIVRNKSGSIGGKITTRFKKQCGPGRKLVDGACVPIQGSEKAHKRQGVIKTKISKRQQGAALLIKAKKKLTRTLTKRHSMGLK